METVGGGCGWRLVSGSERKFVSDSVRLQREQQQKEREMLVHSLLLSVALSCCCSAHGQKTAKTALLLRFN